MGDPSASSNIGLPIARPEPELIRAAGQGDLRAFNSLVVAYQDAIFTLAYHLAPPGVDAEVIAQTVVQRMYRELPGYRGGDFRIWIYKLLVKTCREAWRSKQAETKRRSPWGKNGAISSRANSSPAGELAGDEGAYRGSMQGVIMGCLRDLPFELRLAVVMVDFEGLDYEMTAEVLGKRKSEVRDRLGMARRQLCQPLLDGLYIFEKEID